MADLLVDYVAAGFDPLAFWQITPRLYDLHMQGAIKRIEREIEAQNRHAYHAAALTGSAMAGQLPEFEKVFRPRGVRPMQPQSLAALEANIMAIGISLGAVPIGLQIPAA